MPVAEPISWTTAERVAARVAGREPFSSSYLGDSLQRDFRELTVQAETLVREHTGLVSDGPARVRVTDREGWAKANIASFRRLLRPVTDRFASRSTKSLLAPAARHATGAQLGVVLGWMSTRVLGQYDLLLFEDDSPHEQDIVYYVGPNVLALERRYAFSPREFRLWIALHECTHRAQFTAVPWLAPFFKQQVDSLLETTDPTRLHGVLKRAVDEARAGNNPIADGGLLSLFATPAQQDALKRILGLMSLLEGHGEVVMSAAGKELVLNADRFHRVLHARRSNARGVAKTMQRLLGVDAKLRQYADGARFVRAVEAAGGRALFDRVWEGPELLPTHEEIRDPSAWIARVGTAAHAD